MKFKCAVDVNLPRKTVVELFKNPKYLKEYQDGFLRKELVSGNDGQDGAISKMFYKNGNRDMELTETITANRLPESFEAHYHHIHMDNTMKCYFTALDEQTTRYESEIEYIVFRGFMVKAMAFLFPGMFKKQVQKWLNNFKAFAEQSNISA